MGGVGGIAGKLLQVQTRHLQNRSAASPSAMSCGIPLPTGARSFRCGKVAIRRRFLTRGIAGLQSDLALKG
ncbi:hypothetical protein HMPREF0762_01111 [Slackia exigua ATCC 700122]|uniref:Uncharacterized protein n=1 Tax=Slackia exigua (strain ATCC 700122 / DSM 15923 / CIP 105133 / JCM 11022 / KCTC 5966 / S-7) TaxID=649764 RepID=D0WH79_SLAES|nr:hypothetical protein HMPREF0762_01111 [Slackia exigua ATCC 700122]